MHTLELLVLLALEVGGGKAQVPIVIRGPGGVGRQLGAEHSQRLESYFQSIPGVQLVACSTVANSKALLKSAIRSDNPIIFFEHVLLYNVKGTPLWFAGSEHTNAPSPSVASFTKPVQQLWECLSTCDLVSRVILPMTIQPTQPKQQMPDN